ncbi:MAG: 2-oxoacid:acceptor oxidoreductase subunit alpha, partial [Phycisphaerae bacterium]
MDVNIRIAGEAGQGLLTTGDLLVGALASMGLHTFASKSYMSRVRGGLNWFDIRIADDELFAPCDRADVLVALSTPAVEILSEALSDDAVVLIDGKEAPQSTPAGAMVVDLTQAAKDAGGKPVMANTVAAGVVFALLGYEADALGEYVKKQFARLGEEIAEQNAACARKGAELSGDRTGCVEAPKPTDAPQFVTDGASAAGLSASVAGVKFATAYPMTPSTATFQYLAKAADKYGIVVEQAEDEIAAVNMACGATYAGAPAMTMTSGGGFALMTEGLSLAGILELPVVILLAQRPGPATGLPTRTAQQDFRFAQFAGHGEFPRAIYAPGTQKQTYELVRKALADAHKAQTPAIILTDQFLQDAQKNIDPLPDEPDPIDRRIVTDAGNDYTRYAVTESGVSPRAIPGGDAFVRSDSDEHTNAGVISEDLAGHLAQQDKRMRKANVLAETVLEPELYPGEGDDADTLLICWGSTYGPCREAVDILRRRGESAGMLHIAQLLPLPADAISRHLKDRKRVICVEGNATGQLSAWLCENGLCPECEKILRYDGLAFTAEY